MRVRDVNVQKRGERMVLVRKLVRAGPSSYTVSLPKDWIAKNKLEKGSSVYVMNRSDHELIITPHLGASAAPERSEITITVDGKPQDSIHREITAAYVNNAGTITLVGKEIEKKSDELRRFLHDFVALEIAEQSTKRIVAKDLLNLSEVGVEHTLRRMDMIVRSMLSDLAECKRKEVQVRDYDMNRLYFLLMRLTRASLKDKSMAEQLKIDSTQTLGYAILAQHLESVADAAKALAEQSASQLKKAGKDVQELRKHFEIAMAAWFVTPKDKVKADKVARDVAKLTPAAEALRTMAQEIGAIARLVIDEA